MQVPVYDLDGKEIEKIEVSDFVFGVPFNKPLVHQAMVRQQANARQGTVGVKTRGQVEGSTRKLYAQKHTGNARAGSIRSPLRRGGGIIFGPQARSYRQAMPKKMRRLAIRCLLSAKARDAELVIIDQLKLDQPKTKEMVRILSALNVSSPAIIAMAEPEENVAKSARNLPGVKTLQTNLLNVVDMLSHRKLLMTVASVRKAEELWGEQATEGGSNGPV